MRTRDAYAWLVALVSACGDTDAVASRYLSDPEFRRAELRASLVNADNDYSRLRLAHYDTDADGDWSRLPAWNPRVEPIALRELDAPGGADARRALSAEADALVLPRDDPPSEAELIALGKQAFFRYPVQLSPASVPALRTRETLSSYGFWLDPQYGAGGLLRTETSTGVMIALSCATCHARRVADLLLIGAGNDRLDLGSLSVDANPDMDARHAQQLMGWGPGRIDVTTASGLEPVRIADLRPIRYLSHLHADATLRMRDRTSLAIRIETLIITSHHQQLRPPRVVALGLAAYLEALADALPTAAASSERERAGAAILQARCASCHVPPAFSGAPVALSEIGTEPTLGRSRDRGTGHYRVPSLHGVGSRGPLLHDASLNTLADLFDPMRISVSYRGARRGPGAVIGHSYGLDLDASERAALLAYLERL